MAALYPESITILTSGSYTVPAGKYAVANPSSIINGQNFTINGSAVTYIKNSLVDLTMPAGTVFSVQNNTRAVIQVYVIP